MLSIGSKESVALYYSNYEVNHLNLSDHEIYDGNIPVYLKAFKKVSTITKELVDSLNMQYIENIVIPKNVTDVEVGAFSSCENVAHVSIYSNLQNKISSNILYGMTFSQEHDLKITLEYISGVTNVARGGLCDIPVPFFLEIAEGYTRIDESFLVKSNNREVAVCIGVSLPTTLSYIDAGNEYSTIKECHIKDINSFAQITGYYVGGHMFLDNSPDYKIFLNNELITKLTFKTGISEIASGAFRNYKYLEEITIPDSVTGIGNSTFEGCTNLNRININNIETWLNIYFSPLNATSYPAFAPRNYDIYINGEKNTDITIPNSITDIKPAVFYYFPTITRVTIPDSVTSIGKYAFRGCSSLTGITIPDSVTSIDYEAFDGCNGLINITVSSGNTKYDSRDNCNAIIETSTNKLVIGCKNTVIPDSVASIGGHAFYNRSSLTSVTIGNSVTSIGYYAFSGCSGLTSVTIPNSVTSLGEGAFYSCSGLTNVTIPNSVASIGYFVFRDCSGLTSVEVGQNFNVSLDIKSGDYTPEVMVNIFNNLKDLTGGTAKTLTVGSTNLAKLTEEQKAIATNKNWVLK